jgi:hypothetical protein
MLHHYRESSLMTGRTIAGWYSHADGMSEACAYLDEEGLLPDLQHGASDGERIPPDYRDLARLHALIRSRRPFTVLEFGLGFSTMVMADALVKNRREWDALQERPRIRNSTPFELHSVDTSPLWVERTAATVPTRLKPVVSLHYSAVSAGLFQDCACHYYDALPEVVPDLIYLDGPDPTTVVGNVGGLGWKNPDRVVTAADILRMEPQLLPGTLIVVDGRTANVRFLAAHLYRRWKIDHDPDGDVTVLELDEPPLGAISAATIAYQRAAGAALAHDPR